MHEVDLEALDQLLGNIKAIEVVDKLHRLELELRAIEFWDSHYYADQNRDANDTSAFHARQIRKQQLLQELGREKQMSKSLRR